LSQSIQNQREILVVVTTLMMIMAVLELISQMRELKKLMIIMEVLSLFHPECSPCVGAAYYAVHIGAAQVVALRELQCLSKGNRQVILRAEYSAGR
jgi:hypothetical protein